MKRWALVVAGLYVLLLVALTAPAILAAFLPGIAWKDPFKVYVLWPYWLWLAIMGVSQFALLAIPVRVASRRPVTRGSLWPTVLAGGLMAGALLVGALYSISEFIFKDHGNDWSVWVANGAGILAWVVWAVIFYRLGLRSEPSDWISAHSRALLKGSILELLIAVPTHIVARYRNYCCAGFMTFIGLTMGISVMLFSFGPAVFFLYVDRWRRLHPKSPSCP